MADDTSPLMMELICKHTILDEATLEKLATIVVGVCPDDGQQFTELKVMLQVDGNDHWSRKQDLPRRKATMAALMDQMALVIKERFLESGRDKDLEIAISLHRKALELTPNTLPAYPLMFTKFAKALEARYDHSGRMADLDLVIACHRTFLSVWRPPFHATEPSHLENLASALGKRFNISRDEDDRDEAIAWRRQVISLTPPSTGIEHIDALRLLAHTLIIRYRQEKQLVDLDEAIELYRTALMLGSMDVDRTKYLRELAEAIYPRFRLSHSTEDMAELIGLYQQLSKRHREAGPDRDRIFSILSLLMKTRFEGSGAPEDLDEAISLQLRLLKVQAVSHPERYSTLINLGSFLRYQFEQRGDRNSLDEAVAFLREAVELVPAPHKARPTALNNLSIVLRERFEEVDQHEDLREAIDLQREALTLEPASKENGISSLTNLGAALWSQYEPATGTEAELAAIISLYEEALVLLPDPHPHRPTVLGNLGNTLRARFAKTGERDDLSRAIDLIQKALFIMGPTHPDSCAMAFNLGLAFGQLYALSKDFSHLDDGVTAFRSAATNQNGTVSKKFRAARLWAEFANRFSHPSALEAYRTAIELLPLVVAIDADLELRQQRLMSKVTNTDGLAVAAAGCALEDGKVEEAIEFLEEGRAVFWSQAMRLRSPMGDLEFVDPELAEQLRSIRKKLEVGSFGSGGLKMKSSENIGRLTEHQELIRLRQLHSEWDATLGKIRNLR